MFFLLRGIQLKKRHRKGQKNTLYFTITFQRASSFLFLTIFLLATMSAYQQPCIHIFLVTLFYIFLLFFHSSQLNKIDTQAIRAQLCHAICSSTSYTNTILQCFPYIHAV